MTVKEQSVQGGLQLNSRETLKLNERQQTPSCYISRIFSNWTWKSYKWVRQIKNKGKHCLSSMCFIDMQKKNSADITFLNSTWTLQPLPNLKQGFFKMPETANIPHLQYRDSNPTLFYRTHVCIRIQLCLHSGKAI